MTNQENAEIILQKGLKPLIGENSKLCEENEPAIYLCKREDLPYWRILLDRNVPICVNLTKEQVKLSRCRVVTNEAMKNLCISYIYKMGNICSAVIRYYYTNSKDTNQCQYLKKILKCTLQSLSQLDYTSLTQKEIMSTIIDSGDGSFAFTDHYLGEEIRLYEKISMYGNDELSEYTNQLTKYIKHVFGKYLKLNTGGWSM